MPEAAPGHYQLLFVILGTTVTTVGPLLLAGVVGFVRLGTKVDLYRAENTKDHDAITQELRELNGTTKKSAKAISVLEANERKNHP